MLSTRSLRKRKACPFGLELRAIRKAHKLPQIAVARAANLKRWMIVHCELAYRPLTAAEECRVRKALGRLIAEQKTETKLEREMTAALPAAAISVPEPLEG